jgi:hypothetical protein
MLTTTVFFLRCGWILWRAFLIRVIKLWRPFQAGCSLGDLSLIRVRRCDQTCSLSWNPSELASGLVPVAGYIKILTCVMMGFMQPLHEIRRVVFCRLLFVPEVLKAGRRTGVSLSQTLCSDCGLVRWCYAALASRSSFSGASKMPSTGVSLLI